MTTPPTRSFICENLIGVPFAVLAQAHTNVVKMIAKLEDFCDFGPEYDALCVRRIELRDAKSAHIDAYIAEIK